MSSRIDKEALRTFYDETGGFSWRRKSGWEDGNDNLRNWEGVSVNTSGRVVRIQLSENNLEGYIPAVIWNLTELEYLDLGKNQLTGNFPLIPKNHEIKLAVLIMGNNKLTGLPDLHLFPNLKRAELQGNNIEGQLSENIGRCDKLEYLLLSSNKLKGSLPRALGNLVNLSELDISKNKFSGTIPEECKDMRNLTVFNVKSNDDLAKPASAGSRKSDFYQWMMDQNLEKYLEHLSYMETAVSSGYVEQFPSNKIQQGVLPEGPHRAQTEDCLGFDDYADVLVTRLKNPKAWPVGLGIFAQWGAGKTTLCDFIIRGLTENESVDSSREHWFVRWLWATSGGAVLYALAAVFKAAVQGICCPSLHSADASRAQENTSTGDQSQASGRCCYFFKKNTVGPGDVESGDGESTSPRCDIHVESIVACFDACIFEDSEVLWAVLVGKIFEQVEECFGEGAVRATRVQHAISSFTCRDWFTVAFWSTIMVLVAAAAGWVAELIARLDGQLERALAGLALTGVPLAFVLWVIKGISMLFKSQGKIILSKAKAMGESVGLAHLGFMAEVQEEMQILFDMLQSKSTKNVRYLLVVSIDNLDRCPHRQVVKVLEAVHLFFYRKHVNVAVMLALDPRWTIAAIEKDMGEGMIRDVSGSEYLDKIIHWPFFIPGVIKNERAKLIRQWLYIEDESEEKSNEESTQGEGGSQSAVQPRERGDESEEKSSEVSTKGEGGSASADQQGKRGDGSEEKTSDVSTKREGECASADQPRKRGAATGGMGAIGMSYQTSSRAHISAEVAELEEMTKYTTSTPRRAKRVYDIYGIQRELAMKRAIRNRITFSKDDARKLLRWTIMSEFWPFHTACLAAITTREKQHLDEPAQTLLSMFVKYGEDFLAKIFEDKPLAARNGEVHIGSYAANGARRLLGMDEDNEGFFQLLASKPQLVVGDFHEDKLGLLRLSINLNPAMVAKVTSWSRSNTIDVLRTKRYLTVSSVSSANAQMAQTMARDVSS